MLLILIRKEMMHHILSGSIYCAAPDVSFACSTHPFYELSALPTKPR